MRVPDLGQNGVAGSLVDARILNSASFLSVCYELPGRKTQGRETALGLCGLELAEQFRDLSGAEAPASGYATS